MHLTSSDVFSRKVIERGESLLWKKSATKGTRNLCKLVLINGGGHGMPENTVKLNEDEMSLILFLFLR